MPRIRETYFEGASLCALTRHPVRIEMLAAGASTGAGPNRGMLSLEIAMQQNCGWVTVYHGYTRYPVGRLVSDGRRVLYSLMDTLYAALTEQDNAKLSALGPRLRLLNPVTMLSSGGVACDDAAVEAEARRLADERARANPASSPCLMARAA